MKGSIAYHVNYVYDSRGSRQEGKYANAMDYKNTKRRPRERNTFGFILYKLVQFTFHVFMSVDIK